MYVVRKSSEKRENFFRQLSLTYLLDFPPVAKSLAGVGKWVSSGLVPGPPHRSRQGWITVLSMTITITKTVTKSKLSNKFQSLVVPYTLIDNHTQQHDTMNTKEISWETLHYKVQRFNQYKRVVIPPNYNFWSLDQLCFYDASKYQLTSLQVFLITLRKASVASLRMQNQQIQIILQMIEKVSSLIGEIILKYGKQGEARAELISIFRNSMETL